MPNKSLDPRSYGNVRIDNETKLDLRKQFPISSRLVIKELLPWLLAFTALIIFYSLNFSVSSYPTTSAQSEQLSLSVFQDSSRFNQIASLYQFDNIVLYGSTFLILSIVAIYYEIQRYSFRYRIDGFRLLIRRGLIWVDEGSLPLTPITEVYLRRGIIDVILGIAEVNIAVPIDSVRSFARIEGLKLKNAHHLLDFLTAQLNQQVASGDSTVTTHDVHHANSASSFHD